MASSGSFSKTIESGVLTLKLYWSQAKDTANNASVVTVTAKFVSNTEEIDAGNITFSCLGKSASASNYSRSRSGTSQETTTIATKTFTISHGSDGTKSGNISVSIGNVVFFVYGEPYIESHVTAGGSVTLETIYQPTSPSVSASSANMGSSITISLPRKKSSFTHSLAINCGSQSTTVSGIGTSYTFTIPISYANEITNGTSKQVQIICTTLDGSSYIGTKTTVFNAVVPSTVVPTIDDVVLSDNQGLVAIYGFYIKSKSKLKTVVTASGAYGSTIKSYKIVANGTTYTSATSITDFLNNSGNNSVTITVTDTRNRTASTIRTIAVTDYTSPTVSLFEVTRNETNEETADVKLHTAVTPLNNANDNNATLYYKEKNASSWTLFETLSGGAYAREYEVRTTETFDIDKTFDWKVVLQDDFSTLSIQTELETTFSLIDYRSTGKGIAFGKSSEKDAFECNLDAEFLSNVKFANKEVAFVNKSVISAVSNATKRIADDLVYTHLRLTMETTQLSASGSIFLGTFSVLGDGTAQTIPVFYSGRKNANVVCTLDSLGRLYLQNNSTTALSITSGGYLYISGFYQCASGNW